ncbi:MAG TPA: thiamine pyrophosphate-binding protein [Candidatus Acidoferrales bacterium]|nr:thiamine pyrophosphate-binding protein [Candidatus Acidoferrales bacterium]
MERKYGSDLIVDLMLRFGIEYAALNPGSSFRGLHDSIVNYAGNRPQIIQCPHEEVAVSMAHGYAKVTGRPMVAIVHDVVGLLHASMAIYYAYLDRAPVLVLGATGPMEISRRRPHIDWIHTAVAQGGAVRDYTKWDYQPVGAEDVAESFARAYRVATSDPPGPVYLCYDAGFQEDPLSGEVALPDPARVLPTRLAADPQALERLAGWLLEAENPVIVTEYLGRHPEAVAVLVELAELLGAAVLDAGDRLCFPSDHPLNLTGAEEILESADLVLALDVRDFHGVLSRVDRVRRRAESRVPAGCRLAEIGLGDLGIRSWSQDFQRLQPVDLSVLGDTALALPVLVACCRERLGRATASRGARARQHAERHRRLRAEWAAEAEAAAGQEPIATAHLVRTVGEAIRGTDWVLTANTVRDWARRLWDFDQPHRHAGQGLGTATQIGTSLGVALAYRGSGRLVVDLQPDGDLLYDAAALWVASYHRIPMLVVMYNNRAYYNDWEHQILIARERGRDQEMAYLGMELNNPAPDFAGLARAFGWWAEGPVERPAELRAAVEKARDVVLKEGRPALVDVITAAR